MQTWEKMLAEHAKNWKTLEETDAASRASKQLVGRFIQEPFADSYAVYKITKENKKTVRVEVVTGIGDDWALPYWGAEATVDKAYIMQKINQREMLAKLFS